MNQPDVNRLYAAVRAAEGQPANAAIWERLSQVIGLAWQRREIGEDDARALEEMVRVLRFPRR